MSKVWPNLPSGGMLSGPGGSRFNTNDPNAGRLAGLLGPTRLQDYSRTGSGAGGANPAGANPRVQGQGGGAALLARIAALEERVRNLEGMVGHQVAIISTMQLQCCGQTGTNNRPVSTTGGV